MYAGTQYGDSDGSSDDMNVHGQRPRSTRRRVLIIGVVVSVVGVIGAVILGRAVQKAAEEPLGDIAPSPVATTTTASLAAEYLGSVVAGSPPVAPALGGAVSVAPGVPTTTPVSTIAPLPVQIRSKPAEDSSKPECLASEEKYQGLCYTKCSVLTGMPQATRFSAFSCCPSGDCDDIDGLFNLQTASLVPCTGYDVGSQDTSFVKCPHAGGECLTGEEQFMGVCYEKCATLTNGKYTVRHSAVSCCESANVMSCFSLKAIKDGLGLGDASTTVSA